METTDNNRQSLVDQQLVQKHLSSRTVKNKVFKLIFLACTLLGLVVLIALLTQTLIKGVSHLNLQFFTNFSSSTPSMAGVKGALIGSLWLMLSIIPLSIILGIGTAIYLEEYAKNNKFTQFVKISISNLAGVPSVVFGLLGYTLFVGGAGIEALKMGNSILAAALTMTLLILPIIIVSSQEAIRAVPNSVREASYGLGANKWQTIRRVVLPAALPGILTGFILSLSRALGETAPLVLIGIPTILLATPRSILDQFSADVSQSHHKTPDDTNSHSVIYSTQNLDLWYGENHALQNINLDIYENQITAIIGPSGCGKSTYIKTLNRMVELVPSVKTAGKILYRDQDIFDQKYSKEQLRTNVGMVFQQPNPFPKSIYDNITYGPKIHGIKNKKVLDEIVEKSLRGAAIWDELKDRLHTNAYSLSGGQQQRVCIARCLAIEPEVILMDEPTSALDPISTLRVEELVQELKEKYTIIMVTHNMQQAARVSDKTAFFLNGYVNEYDDTDKIFSNPSNKKTEDYISGRFG